MGVVCVCLCRSWAVDVAAWDGAADPSEAEPAGRPHPIGRNVRNAAIGAATHLVRFSLGRQIAITQRKELAL